MSRSAVSSWCFREDVVSPANVLYTPTSSTDYYMAPRYPSFSTTSESSNTVSEEDEFIPEPDNSSVVCSNDSVMAGIEQAILKNTELMQSRFRDQSNSMQATVQVLSQLVTMISSKHEEGKLKRSELREKVDELNQEVASQKEAVALLEQQLAETKNSLTTATENLEYLQSTKDEAENYKGKVEAAARQQQTCSLLETALVIAKASSAKCDREKALSASVMKRAAAEPSTESSDESYTLVD